MASNQTNANNTIVDPTRITAKAKGRTLSQKLVIAVMPLLILDVLNFVYSWRTNIKLTAEANEKLVNLKAIERVVDVTENLAFHQLWGDGQFFGLEQGTAKRKVYQQKVDSAIEKLNLYTKGNKQLSQALGTQVDDLSQAWQDLKARIENGEYVRASDLDTDQQLLVSENVLPLISSINSNGLYKSKAPEDYFLLQTLNRSLPRIYDSLLKLHSPVIEVFKDKKASPDDRTFVRTTQGIMDKSREDLVNDSLALLDVLSEDEAAKLLDKFDGEGLSQDVINLSAILSNQLLRTDLTNTTYSPQIFSEGMRLLMTQVFDASKFIASNRIEAAQKTYDTAVTNRNISIWLFFITFALVFWMGYNALRRIIQQITSILRVTRRVGQGDLSLTADVTSNDELGTLADTVNTTVQRLRGMVQTEQERDSERTQRERLQGNINNFLETARTISEGDLTQRGEVTEDVLGNVVDAINLMVEEISYTLKDVQTTAERVNAASGNLDSITENILGGSKTQSQDVVQVRNQTQSVSKNMATMAEQADKSAVAADSTLQASARGQESLNDTLTGMQSIRKEVQNIAKSMKGLSDRSQEISEVVETIDSIAKQTHLLALNASLEAAGAGESGARFAVVARQVRTLAEDTAKSAQRVGALVKGIQTEIEGVSISVQDGTKEVEQGYTIASEASSRLKEIAELATASSALAKDMSSSAKTQSELVKAVGRSVDNISQTAQQAEQESAKGRAAAESLRKLAEQLNVSLSRFRLPE